MSLIRDILMGSSFGQYAVYSVCTANPLVIRAAARHAKKNKYLLVIEATANQVNQYGGYTGMKPADYFGLVKKILDEEGLSPDNFVLGGDHLGPLTWQNLPEDDAMYRAEELVKSYVLAGFTKIHLDTSMRLASDDPNAPLDLRVCARRGARLASCVVRTFEYLQSVNPYAPRPVLVIGSEVPVPGGSQVHEDYVTPTSPEDFRRQYNIFREEFEAAGMPFDDVVAFVVQPGVEFGDDFVFQYDRKKAFYLTQALKDYAALVFEGHSTDYQTKISLKHMTEDGIRILKVGPALTFALREALLLAEEIEAITVSDIRKRSHFRKNLLDEMDKYDKYWRKYYSGTQDEINYKKLYSYSDRCRYYLPAEAVEQSIEVLLNNLREIPVALISQYFPRQYIKVMEGELSCDCMSIILDRIGDWCDIYAAACGIKLE